MNQEIDIVYPLGSGSRWQNNEIRYSLRSVEKHLKGFRNIYVVGQQPVWLENVIHIKTDDPLRHNADGNITLKILKACQDPNLSNPFLFINDDHIFLKDIHVLDIKNYHKGDLSHKSEKYFEGGLYVQRLKRTRDILRRHKLPTLHFDCHTPILIDKEKYPEIMNRFEFRVDIGYTMKSLYANSLHLKGLYRPDFNLKWRFTYREIEKMTADKTIMAFNDAGITGDLKKFLAETFPNSSKFEDMNTNKQLSFTEALDWLNAEDKSFSKARYDEGVRIYCDLGRNRHLMGIARRTRTERTMKAIQKELEVITRKLREEGMKPLKSKKAWKKPEVKTQKKVTKSDMSINDKREKTTKKSSRPKFNTNDYVDPNLLPDNLREKFEQNRKITKEIGVLHAQMSAVPEGGENNQERKQLADKIVKWENVRDENWKAIDTWWKEKGKLMKVTKASGSLTKEEIDRIEDPEVKALSKDLRIKANNKYIKRYFQSTKERQQEQIRIRKAELKAWGFETE
jgi:hypothetical protein